MNVSEARAIALKRLTGPDVPAPVRSGTPSLDIDLMLSRHLGLPRSSLMAHPELSLGASEDAFLHDVGRRERGEPIAYILGTREFWGLPFSVTPAVLIPKPDTETLVERALEILDSHPDASAVLDACTGSGCVAVSIAHSRPKARVAATDISAEALAVARDNADRLLGPNRVAFFREDLREGLPSPPGDRRSSAPPENPGAPQEGWDLIVSNPPYVPSAVVPELLSDGRGEPALALDGGDDGLELVRPLARNALKALRIGGRLLVETGEYNARAAAAYFESLGYRDIVVHRDLEGQDRVLEGRKPDGP